ncbi:heavy metal sensor histidine kinase [Paraburkholderia rhizosphaerae]|uniref:Sensor protein n=1 Tax=Paraburkholderia rhizosphaerae TaxID=480658 RepID=A0A4R8L858_9BURK|nr:heavy metal sensor histidine kinase [Paraburkholderia rhizosphaerae]TDY38308.1 heavy metal sensor signal transduction histidine kinase [Paraburkholderia rhizosphaerae]
MLTRFAPRTLHSRLTALITLCTSIVLAFSGFALFQALQGRLDTNAREQMINTIAALHAHLEVMKSTDEVPRNAELWTDLLHGHQNMDLAIDDRSGNALFRSSGFRPLPSGAWARAGHKPLSIASRESGLRYLAATASLDGAEVRVAVQYNRNDDLALLRTYAYTIAVIQVSGVLLAAAFAYGIAMLGLSPLRRLIARAEEISSSRLTLPLLTLDAAGDLKELQHAFNGMQQRLNESFTRLSQFSSNLAHDMRTPLTNLQAAAQVALSRPRGAAEYRDVIESSIDEYQRLSRMIEDMLFIARAERADAVLAIRTLDAAEEAARVAGYYEPMADDAEISIKVLGHAQITADLLLYQRALSNLISNALAHAPKGSTVKIECRETDATTVVSVSDCGPGIAPEHVNRVFERFYRVDPSRHDSASGTGLGLAIVKSIMDSHGGQCSVVSRPGVMTTFFLLFPFQPPVI